MPSIAFTATEDRLVAANDHVAAYRAEGTWTVPRVMTAAWEDGDGTTGVFLCNVGPDPCSVALDPAWGSTLTSRDGSGPAPSTLELPSRRIVLVD